MQFLYRDGEDAHFMDSGNYEQLTIPQASIADDLQWTKENDEVEVLYIDNQPGALQLPSAVDLEVTQTEPGLRGDTASAAATSARRSGPARRSRCRCRRRGRAGARRHPQRQVPLASLARIHRGGSQRALTGA